MAGVYKGDRILEVNNESVEGSTHRQVVEQLTPWVAEHFDDPDRKEPAKSEFILYAIGGLS